MGSWGDWGALGLAGATPKNLDLLLSHEEQAVGEWEWLAAPSPWLHCLEQPPWLMSGGSGPVGTRCEPEKSACCAQSLSGRSIRLGLGLARAGRVPLGHISALHLAQKHGVLRAASLLRNASRRCLWETSACTAHRATEEAILQHGLGWVETVR